MKLLISILLLASFSSACVVTPTPTPSPTPSPTPTATPSPAPTPAPGVTSIQFWNSPLVALVGQPLTQNGFPVEVAAYGPSGEVKNSPVVVSISLAGCNASMSGTLTQTTVGGAANFPDLVVNQVGTCQLVAQAPGLPSITSPAFVVSGQ